MLKIRRYSEIISDYKINLKKINSINGKINRLYCGRDEKGYLDFDQKDDTYFLIMVEVKSNYQNQGIATKLIESFFKIVDKDNGLMDISEFLEDGEKYLKHIIEKLKNKYKNIVYL